MSSVTYVEMMTYPIAPTDASAESAEPLPVVAAFDVDGTLIRKDSLFPFLRAIAGPWRFAWGLLRLTPVLVGYGLKLVPNWRAKEAVLRHFLMGMPVAELERRSERFAARVLPKLLRAEALDRLQWHQQQGHQTLLISASLESYLKPLAANLGVDQVLGTRLEYIHGHVSGRLLGKNCYGPEKVARLRQWSQDSACVLYAYGDSRGDRELLAAAQFAYYRRFQD